MLAHRQARGRFPACTDGRTPSTTLRRTCPAILDGCYLGQEGGTAVADVLFGDYNPAGRLPITVPRNVGQLPDYYYQKPSARREYLGTTTEPLVSLRLRPELHDVQVRQPAAWPGHHRPDGHDEGVRGRDQHRENAGRRSCAALHSRRSELGDATDQGTARLPARDAGPGETKTVEFTLGFDELSFLNRDMHRVVEPGTFKIMVGGSSNAPAATATLTVAEPK